jgi:hypothetical protein
VWRPVMAKVVTIEAIYSGLVDVVDLLKLNAMLDARAAELAASQKKPRK